VGKRLSALQTQQRHADGVALKTKGDVQALLS